MMNIEQEKYIATKKIQGLEATLPSLHREGKCYLTYNVSFVKNVQNFKGATVERVKPSVYLSRLNMHYTVLYYSTGKLAPEKVIVVVPLEQVRKEGSRVSFHCEPQWIGIVQYCVVDI